MKISNGNTMVQLDAYLKQARQQPLSSESEQVSKQVAAKTDKVMISDKAREIRQARQDLKQIPDVREKEVLEVKAALKDGTYKVDGNRAATGMLRESFENDMILKKVDMRV
jgi:flagellar biosynthesis anti-sigma factor FlgM